MLYANKAKYNMKILPGIFDFDLAPVQNLVPLHSPAQKMPQFHGMYHCNKITIL